MCLTCAPEHGYWTLVQWRGWFAKSFNLCTWHPLVIAFSFRVYFLAIFFSHHKHWIIYEIRSITPQSTLKSLHKAIKNTTTGEKLPRNVVFEIHMQKKKISILARWVETGCSCRLFFCFFLFCNVTPKGARCSRTLKGESVVYNGCARFRLQTQWNWNTLALCSVALCFSPK